MESNNDKIELLIKKIKFAPNREWVNLYFDLVKRVLDITGLKNHDPRLVMSLPRYSKDWYFPVSINHRYVVALGKKKEDEKTNFYVGLIFNFLAREISQLQNSFEWQFSNLPGEISEPPYFIRFSKFPELLYWLETSEEVFHSWSEALLAEVRRAKSSSYRKSHEEIMYKMTVDVNFRAKILDLAFPDSSPSLELLPEQINNPQEFYEGVSQQIAVNIYERNPVAGATCIEHYGAKCIVCGFNFQDKYGDIGKDFIHIHHTKPLSEIGADYILDPIKDLRPVCPNCHTMLHQRKPTLNINELQSKLKTNN
ncbi:MAG: hypothetical protein CL609_24160 [Anaerolineaceae bacterium]|nr:hypothetical protein [Anaerolineaceae bacterium]